MADVVEQGTSTLFEADEHAWLDGQIAAPRDGDFGRLDHRNLVTFLGDTAARDRRELGSRLIVLYSHILKLRIQPENASKSWRLTIRAQQRAIRRLLKSVPSLKHRADDILAEVYPDAVETAFDEMDKQSASDAGAWAQPDLDVAGLLDYNAAN